MSAAGGGGEADSGRDRRRAPSRDRAFASALRRIRGADFKLLRAIYELHQNEYAGYVEGSRQSAGMVPLDIEAIATRLGVEPVSVLGRLYYHLDPIYAQESADGRSRKPFYARAFGDERACINFPLLEAVLAGLWQERSRDRWTRWIASLSLGLAVASLVVSIVTAATV
jgi:hypothetical protein